VTAYYNEHDPYAAQWLRNLIDDGHIAAGIVDDRSIVDVRPSDLAGFTQCHFFAGVGVWSYALRRAGWPDERPVWTGSCPCQPFSAAGKGGGFDDERHLWPAFFHLIGECRPDVLFGEQVASKDGLGWLDLVHSDLEGAGYACGAVDLCAAGVGAPHIRQRLWWTANRLADACSQRRQQERRSSFGYEETNGRERWVGQHSDRYNLVASDVAIGILADDPRLEGRRVGWDGADQRAAGSDRLVGGMADAGGGQLPQPVGGPDHGNGTRSDGEDDSGSTGRPGPTNGHWRDADWLLCRDGKWRPVESSHVKMVDGPTASLGRLRSGEASDQEILQALLEGVDPETVGQPFGSCHELRSALVLRPVVHGRLDGGADKGSEREKQSPPVGEGGEVSLRAVRGDNATACPPSGREPDEQRPLEFADLVRHLSPSIALAEFRGDDRTAKTLQTLRQAIDENRTVLHSHQSDEAVWSSLGEETQDKLRLGFDASRWTLVVPFPLARGAAARVGRLKGYGNAIVAEAAEAFIVNVMSTLDGTPPPCITSYTAGRRPAARIHEGTEIMRITVTHEFTNHEEAAAHFAKLGGQQSTMAQITPTPAAAAPSGDVDASDLTREDVKKAFIAYVQKPGSGHTAQTGLEIIKSHGLAALKDARPEQFVALKNAFDTAP
jgi:DNA (cytosine-5)-methyltransferase 1